MSPRQRDTPDPYQERRPPEGQAPPAGSPPPGGGQGPAGQQGRHEGGQQASRQQGGRPEGTGHQGGRQQGTGHQGGRQQGPHRQGGHQEGTHRQRTPQQGGQRGGPQQGGSPEQFPGQPQQGSPGAGTPSSGMQANPTGGQPPQPPQQPPQSPSQHPMGQASQGAPQQAPTQAGMGAPQQPGQQPGAPGPLGRVEGPRLQSPPIEEIVRTDVVTAERDADVGEIAGRMAEQDVGSVIVVDDDEPIGIVTDRAIALALAEETDLSGRTAEEFLSGEVITGNTDMTVFEVLDQLQDHGIRRLPIVDEDGSLAGIVTLDDVFVLLHAELENATAIIERQSPRF